MKNFGLILLGVILGFLVNNTANTNSLIAAPNKDKEQAIVEHIGSAGDCHIYRMVDTMNNKVRYIVKCQSSANVGVSISE